MQGSDSGASGRADFALPGGIRLAAVVMERDVG